jgi:hypothetical protein
MMRRAAAALVLAAAAVTAQLAIASPSSAGTWDEVLAARNATAKFHHVARAERAGYAELKDAQGIACIDSDSPAGAMGIHYVNSHLVGDDQVRARKPELVIYEPQPDGSLKLVAQEYVVFQDAWDASHDRAPRLFRHRFELVPEGNRYGLPAFYELHLWSWRWNPTGLFEDYNPRVSCPAA